MTSTDSSRSSSTCSASFTASTIKRSANVASENPPQLRELRLERSGRVRVCVLEEQPDIRLGLCLRRGDAGAQYAGGLVLDRLVELVPENAEPAQVALVAPEALVLLLLLDALEVDVRARVVGSRVRCGR